MDTNRGTIDSGQVTVVVRDGQENFAEEAEEVFGVSVTPVNDAPVITSVAPTNATEDIQYVYQFVASDPEGESLTYSITGAPAGLVMTEQGLVTWTLWKEF